MESKIKFAVLGCGHIGQRHAEMICRNSESELVALIDINTNLEEVLTQKYGNKFFSSLDEFLQSNISADVICIATPNGLHAQQAIKAMTSGFHVVIEKPMALSKTDCEKIEEVAQRTNKHVFCVMQNRYSPPSEWLHSLVKEQRLGNIYMVQINCYWNRDARYYRQGSWHGSANMDGGTLFTQFSHFIDLMYWLFGDIENLACRFANHNHEGLTEFEDSGFVQFDFVSSGMGCINYSTSVWDKNLESSMTVIGEHGSVKIGGQYMDKVVYCHIKDYDMPELKQTNDANDYGPYKGSAANHHYVIENVVDVLKGRSEIATTVQEGLKVVDIIERIYSNK